LPTGGDKGTNEITLQIPVYLKANRSYRLDNRRGIPDAQLQDV